MKLSPMESLCHLTSYQVTIENIDRKYNMINPQGIYKFLQQGQGLNVEIGVGPGQIISSVSIWGDFLLYQAHPQRTAHDRSNRSA